MRVLLWSSELTILSKPLRSACAFIPPRLPRWSSIIVGWVVSQKLMETGPLLKLRPGSLPQ